MGSRYHAVYADWQRDPEAFWARLPTRSTGCNPGTRCSTGTKASMAAGFTGGAECNTCWNCVTSISPSRRADQISVIHDSAITGTQQKFTYAELKQQVVALASVLKSQGVRKGDRVIIYMPMVPEAAFAMLACARLGGAVHSVVFGGFAARELATRIDDAKPNVIISASLAAWSRAAWCLTSRCSTVRSSCGRA